jgi:hypothetical protein
MNAPLCYARQEKGELKIWHYSAVLMEVAATVIILLHPLSALTVIWLFVNQRKWRQTSLKIKGEERKKAVENHEKNGNKLFFYVIGVILLAFISKIFYFQIINGQVYFTDLIPNHFHGWAGLLGLSLMIYLRRLGIKASKNREAGKSFSKISKFHGRVSDVMIYLIMIHAFLGFLYLFTYL